MFGQIKKWSGYFGVDPVRAPDLQPEDVGLLMEMERQISRAQEFEALIQECTERLLAGERDWVKPLNGHGFQTGRAIEHAAIAEAFKALNKKEPA